MKGKTFKFSDAGRSKSKRPRQKNDCTVRSLALTTGVPYDEAFEILRKGGRVCSRPFDIERWARRNVTEVHYFALDKMPLPEGAKRRYRVSDFLRDNPKGYFMVCTARHVFAVVNGVAHDDVAFHYEEDRPVYAWLEPIAVTSPLWQASAVRLKPIAPTATSSRAIVRPVAVVPGFDEAAALSFVSIRYEWALKKNEDFKVEPFKLPEVQQ